MDTLQFLKQCEHDLQYRFDELDEIAYFNQQKY